MDIFSIFMLLGGLGLFLYGMKVMEEGLTSAAGDKLRRWLEVLTKNRFVGLLVGAGVTAIIQSSSATTVMTVGFVNAGLMTIAQAISVNMGANIGTTITAQIISFKISDIAPLFIFIGVIMLLFVNSRKVKRIGMIIAGLGILFVGLNIMGEAMEPLRTWQPFIDFLVQAKEPAIGILAATVFTAIIQSSSATMGILLTLAGQGLLTYEGSIYLMLGAAIGTCITAVLASIGGTKDSKRTALANCFFVLIGVAVFCLLLAFLPIVEFVGSWTPGDTQRQMANFFTFFKIVIAAMFIWCPQVLEKMARAIVRGEDKKDGDRMLRYITKDKNIPPAVAIGQAIREVERMMDCSMDNFKTSIRALETGDASLIDDIAKTESIVDYLNYEITDALSRLSQVGLSEGDGRVVSKLFHIVSDLERISDHADNIGEVVSYGIEHKAEYSAASLEEIHTMSASVIEALENCRTAFCNGDRMAARRVVEIEQLVDDMEHDYNENHIRRLTNGECSAASSTLFDELITNFERVADHTTNIAFYVIDGKL